LLFVAKKFITTKFTKKPTRHSSGGHEDFIFILRDLGDKNRTNLFGPGLFRFLGLTGSALGS
jgi:hypothetical protein